MGGDNIRDEHLARQRAKAESMAAAKNEVVNPDEFEEDRNAGMGNGKQKVTVADLESQSSYHAKGMALMRDSASSGGVPVVSSDKFSASDAKNLGRRLDVAEGSYVSRMRERRLGRDEMKVNAQLRKQEEAERLNEQARAEGHAGMELASVAPPKPSSLPTSFGGIALPKVNPDAVEFTAKRSSRWGVGVLSAAAAASSAPVAPPKPKSRWATASSGAVVRDEQGQWDAASETIKRLRAQTTSTIIGGATPALGSKWGATPMGVGGFAGAATPTGRVLQGLKTPALNPGMTAAMTPLQIKEHRRVLQQDFRSRPLSNAELDAMLPGKDEFGIVEPPPGYQGGQHAADAALLDAGSAAGDAPLYNLNETEGLSAEARAELAESLGFIEMPEGLPDMAAEDKEFFGDLLDEVEDPSKMTKKQQDARFVMQQLLKIKSGTPSQRRSGMQQIKKHANSLDPEILVGKVRDIMISDTLDPQERNTMVKVMKTVIQVLGENIRPCSQSIMAAMAPQLIDRDGITRVVAREVVSSLARAVGLNVMIACMRPDLDHEEEYVRNVTARAFAVVAVAVGVHHAVPFLKAVCRSQTWQARHTGAKIVREVATYTGSSILPHLPELVNVLTPGIQDPNSKVRAVTALALSVMAKVAAPFGIEAFLPVMKPLIQGLNKYNGKGLAAFLGALGNIVGLMEETHAPKVVDEMMPVLVRQFDTTDVDMRASVLAVVQQITKIAGVTGAYLAAEVVPRFFPAFWIPRNALEGKIRQKLVTCTIELSEHVGAPLVLSHMVLPLADKSVPFRNMAASATRGVVKKVGVASLATDLENRLVDALLTAFQRHSPEIKTQVVGLCLGDVLTGLGPRAYPYIPQIINMVKFRLNNAAGEIRAQAATLVSSVAGVLAACGQEKELQHLGEVMFQQLGEEFPAVLAAIISGIHAVVKATGIHGCVPPARELLPRLTPILKNRNEQVMEAVIKLVGHIADEGGALIHKKEWMRVCFDLLEMLRAHRRSIRKACISAFGSLARAVGPANILGALLDNLRVQERQMRVCTTVALAVVAERCGPFTVLPALMNEYLYPENNVQNGVLKSLTFLFETVGPVGAGYLETISSLLADALCDRDRVHRQTACTAVKHLAVGSIGQGKEEAVAHLLNYVWPNILVDSPHTVSACMEAIEASGYALGGAQLFQYVVVGLFHPSRKIRRVYWHIYNSALIHHPEALVSAYPELPADPFPRYAYPLQRGADDPSSGDFVLDEPPQALPLRPDVESLAGCGESVFASPEENVYRRSALLFHI